MDFCRPTSCEKLNKPPTLIQTCLVVRGLGSFVEGKGTMTGWRLDTNISSFLNTGSEGDLNENQQHLEGGREIKEKQQTSDFQLPRPAATPLQSHQMQDSSNSDSSLKVDRTQSSDGNGVDNVYSAAMSVTTNVSTVRTNATVQSEEPLVKAIEDVFSRAANIIREAIEIEGALFLDANVDTFGGLVPDNDSSSNSSSAPSVSTIGGANEATNDDDAEGNKTCTILGYSTSGRSSIDGRTGSSIHEAVVPEKFLRNLLRRYPGGKVFTFDEDGTVQSSTDEEFDSSDQSPTMPPGSLKPEQPPTPKRKPKSQFSRQNEAQLMVSYFPGARSIALVPIWDSRRERWFAGSLLWTKTPARIFTPKGELSYLRAFGATIMAEITRLDTSLAEKATSDLLGSLSHELRSPLHGVVAAVELLQDTDIDAFQGNLVHTMESCGRTLLDSIDHLLDYTKINRLVKDQRQNAKTRVSPSHRMKSFQSQMTNFASTVELAVLAEETVESMFAGHNFHKMSISQLVRNENRPRDLDSLRNLGSAQTMESIALHEGYDVQTLLSDQDSVSVYMNIDPNVPWTWHIAPGAVRRIIMNLLGNSLKYTRKGFILISLKQEQSLTKSKRGGYINLVLNVSDSGKGIAPEFLHNRAFKPFSQEDSLDPGTGLGLSIVHQISKALSGTVQIESQLRRGTSVTVTMPLQLPHLDMRNEMPFSDRISALKGLRVSLRGLDTMAEAPGLSTKSPPIEARLMETICKDWLHLDIIPSDVEDIRPDVVICTAFHLTRTGPATPDENQQPPVVAICSNALAAHSLSGTYANAYGKGIFEFISQP